ncbi:MAG: DUF3305 domain-containing protein [Methylobacteriaceae bacterium]|nr:DUF3305 domain-containing protein [Methylobacteriaceae bacterium]
MTGAKPSGRFTVGIVVAKRRLANPWVDHAWIPVAALPAAPSAAPWSLLSVREGEELFYAGAVEIELHPAETAHYRDNLRSDAPSLWVALRPAGPDEFELATVTVDPYEGEALAEGIGEIVEAVPMPDEIAAEVEAFVEAFHVERPFFKRQRDRANTNALARRAGGRQEPDE